MVKPKMLPPQSNASIKSVIVPHLSWKDSIEITIPSGIVSGYNRIERSLGDKKLDSLEFFANESGSTIIRWHLPPKLFIDDQSYQLSIIPLIIPPPHDEPILDAEKALRNNQ